MKKIVLLLILFTLSSISFGEELKSRYIQVLVPGKGLHKNPVWPVFTVADSSNKFAKEVYDKMIKDPDLKAQLDLHVAIQKQNLEPTRKKLIEYRKKIYKNKSEQEIIAQVDKVIESKIKPLKLVCGKTYSSRFTAGSAYIREKDANGKYRTDFQYFCPKVYVNSNREDEGDLKALLAHEIGHNIMDHYYEIQPKSWNIPAAFSHWQSKMTTPQLAITEGFAEYHQFKYGKDALPSQDLLLRKEGGEMTLRSHKELNKVEGFVAKFFLELDQSEVIENGSGKILGVLKRHKPWSLKSFIKAYKKDYPGDKYKIDQVYNKASSFEIKQNMFTSAKMDVDSIKRDLEKASSEYDNTSMFKHPIKKFNLWRKKSNLEKKYKIAINRYVEMGFPKEMLEKKMKMKEMFEYSKKFYETKKKHPKSSIHEIIKIVEKAIKSIYDKNQNIAAPVETKREVKVETNTRINTSF